MIEEILKEINSIALMIGVGFVGYSIAGKYFQNLFSNVRIWYDTHFNIIKK